MSQKSKGIRTSETGGDFWSLREIPQKGAWKKHGSTFVIPVLIFKFYFSAF